ncbi:Dentin sialoprotein [Actinidia chinensis var. chinensis]|uniref:Dentin sialoprotein n=1 Tax=Actinidia chinensis var. chinensis TaxID=1590841 RepID=A0A2R6PXP0_ACTCC|nr:Dentin sialoprotein [Actinidia chinensis var. chinensis]
MESSSSTSEVGAAEDVIQALLDYLVDPLLPLKSSGREVPSLAQQQSVAKQVHAVVLIYNYYLRKQHADIEFLGFESFCKLAVTLKPTLMGYMKLMHQSDYAELDDLEEQLSVTEKAIMNACDMSLVLGASKNATCIEGWPVSKVAVLLTDSSGGNCLLQFSCITNGVWSVIEKDHDVCSISSDSTVVGQKIYKRKRHTKKPLINDINSDEAGCREAALSAVKEVTGINQSDLVVLESHVVYSLSKEKTAARFYIMQSTRSISEELQVPIKDVIESLQGPLVRKSSWSWTVTSVVEYFHVLPYAGILTDWYSRKVFPNGLQDLRAGLENVDVKSSQRIDNLRDEEVIEDRDDSNKNSIAAESVGNEASGTNAESLKQCDENGSGMICLSDSSIGPQIMDIDDSSMVQNEYRSKSTGNIIEVCHHQKKMASAADSNINAETSGVKAEMSDSMQKSGVPDFKDEKVDTGNKTCTDISSVQDELPIGDCALGPIQLGSKYLEKLHTILATKENALSQTALRVLLRKRNKLSCQLRNLEDEIAVCDKNIQTILNGGEDNLAVKIEAIIDADNDELDDMCYENNWTLPTYRVSPVDGGFRANITVKGLDFECSEGSGLHSNPRLARESAAAQMIAKLRSMAGENPVV